MDEIAADLREGLLALAVGAGLSCRPRGPQAAATSASINCCTTCMAEANT